MADSLEAAAEAAARVHVDYAAEPPSATFDSPGVEVEPAKSAAREVAEHAKAAAGEVAQHARTAASDAAAQTRDQLRESTGDSSTGDSSNASATSP